MAFELNIDNHSGCGRPASLLARSESCELWETIEASAKGAVGKNYLHVGLLGSTARVVVAIKPPLFRVKRVCVPLRGVPHVVVRTLAIQPTVARVVQQVLPPHRKP